MKITNWPGLAKEQVRELAREHWRVVCFTYERRMVLEIGRNVPLAVVCDSLDRTTKKYGSGRDEAPVRDGWLDDLLRKRGCPEDQLETWREIIMAVPLGEIVTDARVTESGLCRST
jgi:hypothetical protein